MKIRPVILCGGAGTRLWPKSKKYQAKQFIDFGGWTLLAKTLDRIIAVSFDRSFSECKTPDTLNRLRDKNEATFSIVKRPLSLNGRS